MLKESSLRRFPISYSELSRNNPTPDSDTWSVWGLARLCILLMLGVKPSFRFYNKERFKSVDPSNELQLLYKIQM